MTSPLRLASVLTLLVAIPLTGCGRKTKPVVASSTNVNISFGKTDWAQTLDYRAESGEIPTLTWDGVRIELRDPANFQLRFGAIGLDGITALEGTTVVSSSFKTTKIPQTGAKTQSGSKTQAELLTVGGKPLRIADHELTWGGTLLGTVAKGDTVIVDGDGVRIER